MSVVVCNTPPPCVCVDGGVRQFFSPLLTSNPPLSPTRDRQEASYDGVLGGQAAVNEADVRESRAFLTRVLGADRVAAAARCGRGPPLTAVDCGAGVGRVSEQLLLPLCAVVDVVEPSGHLIAVARTALATAATAPGARGVADRFLQVGLQDFDPEPGRYDIIWVQWALLYLTDGEKCGGWRGGDDCILRLALSNTPQPSPHPSDDAIAFIRRAMAALRPGGALVIKENVCSKGFVVDSDDKSLTRSPAYMRSLLEKSGAVLTAEAAQKDFPKGLFAVRMFGVRKE